MDEITVKTVEIDCPACRLLLSVETDLYRHRVVCPHCGFVFRWGPWDIEPLIGIPIIGAIWLACGYMLFQWFFL